MTLREFVKYLRDEGVEMDDKITIKSWTNCYDVRAYTPDEIIDIEIPR